MTDRRTGVTGVSARPMPFGRRILASLGMILLTLFLAFVGSAMALQGVSEMRSVLSMKHSGVERTATVSRIETTIVTRTVGETTHIDHVSLPVMEFEYEGRRHEFTAQALSGNRSFDVGEPVMVVFPEGDPGSAVLSEFRNEAWAVPLALGLVLLLGALLFGWASWLMCFGRP